MTRLREGEADEGERCDGHDRADRLVKASQTQFQYISMVPTYPIPIRSADGDGNIRPSTVDRMVAICGNGTIRTREKSHVGERESKIGVS